MNDQSVRRAKKMDDSITDVLDKSAKSASTLRTKEKKPITQIRRNGFRLIDAPSPTVDKVFLSLKAESRAFVASQQTSADRRSI